ncbi:MAG: TetR family transcriptional regulator C-terminal domain-containing protein [Roseobacter sp.]
MLSSKDRRTKSLRPLGATRTAPKEVRKQQLIDATIKSIATYGLSGTTMNKVTRFAGLSVGIVNFHFESKDKLFEETLLHLANEHREKWRGFMNDADLSAKDRLLAIVSAEFDTEVCQRDKLTVWTSFYGECSYRTSYRKIVSDIDSERWQITKALCSEIIADGGYEALNADEIAETLEGMYDGFCLNILLYPQNFTADDAQARVHGYLALCFPHHFQNPSRIKHQTMSTVLSSNQTSTGVA